MNKDTKRTIKIVGGVNPQIVAVQVEDYCPTKYKIKIKYVEAGIKEEN